MKTLKEKREELSSLHKGHYWEEDVIKFIKLDWANVDDFIKGKITAEEMVCRRIKLTGFTEEDLK